MNAYCARDVSQALGVAMGVRRTRWRAGAQCFLAMGLGASSLRLCFLLCKVQLIIRTFLRTPNPHLVRLA